MSTTDIPGDVGGLLELGSQLTSAASQIQAAQGRIAQNGLSNWTGNGGSQFREKLEDFHPKLGGAAEALSTAGAQVTNFAKALQGFQDTAQWQTKQISNSRASLEAAQAAHGQAQTRLDEANLKHSLATDPISLRTAKALVNVAEDLFRSTRNAVDDAAANLAKYTKAAEQNFDDYQQAVKAAARAIEDAGSWSGDIILAVTSHMVAAAGSGKGGLVGWFDKAKRDVDHDASDAKHAAKRAETDVKHASEHLAKDVDLGARAAAHGVERVEHDVNPQVLAHVALHEMDEHWSGIRKTLLYTAAGASFVVAGVAMASGVGAPAAFVIGGLSSALISEAVAGGDEVEARASNQDSANRTLAQRSETGDVVGAVVSTVLAVGSGAGDAAETSAELTKNDAGAVEDYLADHTGPVGTAVKAAVEDAPAQMQSIASYLNEADKSLLQLPATSFVDDHITEYAQQGALGRLWKSLLTPLSSEPRSLVIPLSEFPTLFK